MEGLKHYGNPEIAKRENQRAINYIVPTYAKLPENLLWEKQKSGSEDDWHNARIVDFKRQIRALPAHNFSTDNPLCILDWDFSDSLQNHNDARRNDAEECEHQYGLRNAHRGAFGADRAIEYKLVRLGDSPRQRVYNTDGNDY